MYAGKWITGTQGTSRLETLARELDSRTVRHIESASNQQWNDYCPWMTTVDRLDFFYQRPKHLTKNRSFEIITDQSKLLVLAEAFQTNGAPLGHLLIDRSDDAFFVETGQNEDLVRYRQSIQGSLEWIFGASSTFAARWRALVQEVLPLGYSKGSKSLLGRGLSTHFYRKGVFVQLPAESEFSSLQLALNLVHELGHQALMTYQNADLVVASDQDREVYSVIRKVKRPVIRSFHAFVVTGYMLEFLLSIQHSDIGVALSFRVKHEVNEYRRLVFSAAKELQDASVEYTQLGQEIIDELKMLATQEVI